METKKTTGLGFEIITRFKLGESEADWLALWWAGLIDIRYKICQVFFTVFLNEIISNETRRDIKEKIFLGFLNRKSFFQISKKFSKFFFFFFQKGFGLDLFD